MPGTISKKDGKVTYHALLEDGRIVRRHIDHVRCQNCESTIENDSHINSDNDVFLDLPSLVTSSGNVTNSDDSSNANSSPEPSTTELHRSNRPRHSPAHCQDDLWTT